MSASLEKLFQCFLGVQLPTSSVTQPVGHPAQSLEAFFSLSLPLTMEVPGVPSFTSSYLSWAELLRISLAAAK